MGTKNNLYEHKCELCKRAVANKKNSHIVPSFLVCRTASSDGTCKRNHELVYSIGKTVQVYAGNEVPQNVIERNFDDLSTERIEEELKKNTLSKDFIFCSTCEKALADYLESPYSIGKKIEPQVSYFFWLSVLWRVNHSEILSSNVPKFILSEIRNSLDTYLQAKMKGMSISSIPQKYPFTYRILTCKDYSINGSGCIYAEYNKPNRIFSITLGDYVISYNLKRGNLPDCYTFLGLETEFKQAPSNDGTKYEEVRAVGKEIFDQAYTILLGKAKDYYIKNEVRMIYGLWESLIKQKMALPSLYPSDQFVQRCLENIHNKEKKLGERYTIRNHAISFAEALKEIYGIVVNDD